jgi:hypothetical protein
LTGGRYSQVNLAQILNGPDRGRSLLTGGRCSEVFVNTGLTVPLIHVNIHMISFNEAHLRDGNQESTICRCCNLNRHLMPFHVARTFNQNRLLFKNLIKYNC